MLAFCVQSISQHGEYDYDLTSWKVERIQRLIFGESNAKGYLPTR